MKKIHKYRNLHFININVNQQSKYSSAQDLLSRGTKADKENNLYKFCSIEMPRYIKFMD